MSLPVLTNDTTQIDFINAHLGLGFPIPLVMLNQSEILNGPDIARIIGNFGSSPLQYSLVYG